MTVHARLDDKAHQRRHALLIGHLRRNRRLAQRGFQFADDVRQHVRHGAHPSSAGTATASIIRAGSCASSNANRCLKSASHRPQRRFVAPP
jgi:hypothetical protein